jgi:peptide methionine sulfoxide reductase MsrB
MEKRGRWERVEHKELTREEEEVIVRKGTEPPFSGKYDDFWEKGTYVCKRCNAALYRSEDLRRNRP